MSGDVTENVGPSEVGPEASDGLSGPDGPSPCEDRFEPSAAARTASAEEGHGGDATDPRLTDEYVRLIEGDEHEGAGDVLLLGSVHDHPASSYRIGERVAEFDPNVLALEVTPLSLPWFVTSADREEPHTCEMTAAVAAAPDSQPVAIDGLDAEFFATLVRNLRAEGPRFSTVRAVARGVGAVAKHATNCRLAAWADRYTPYRPSAGEPVSHDCDRTDPPEVQAADERRQASTSLALLRAVERPAPVAVRDETRETCMVRRIGRLREEGDVAAVVGVGHLEAVAAELAER